MTWVALIPLLFAAQVPGAALPLDEVLDSTARHHPLVLGALADLEAATGDARAATGAFDPSLKVRGTTTPLSGYPAGRLDALIDVPTPIWGATLQGGYRLGLGSFPVYYGERETDAFGELRAMLNVPLLRNGPIDRRRATVERTELAREWASLGVAQQRLELRRQASLRWVRWVAAGERRALAQSLLDLARTRQSQLDERARAGDVAAIDAVDNRRAILQREVGLVSATRGVEEAAYELSLFLRDSAGDPVLVGISRLPGPLSPPSKEELEPSLEESLSRRPEVARLDKQKRQAEVEQRFARNQLLPSVDLQVGVSQDLGSGTEPKRSKPEVELMLWLDVPILYRQPLGRLDAATASISKADRQLQLQRERVRVEIGDALSALKAARERARLLRDELALAGQLEAGERKRLDLGESNLLLVNLREASTFESALREVDARADWHRALADLRAATGAP